MKKRGQYRDRISKSRQIRLHRRRVWSRQKLHRKRGGRKVWIFAIRKRVGNFTVIDAPSKICISDQMDRHRTLLFLRRFRAVYLQEEANVILNFFGTRKLTATGTLLFVAELDRALRIGNSRRTIRCRLPPAAGTSEERIVRQVLHQVGVLDLLGHDTSGFDTSTYDETVRHWNFATGTTLTERPGEVLDRHQGKITPALMEGMWKGVSEALTNSRHHAYAADRNDGCIRFAEKRWWMFSQEREGMLTVVVCDLGIGIRRSLPMQWSKSRDIITRYLKNRPNEGRDVAAMELALQIGKSSTGEENRGRGLPQIWNATRLENAGGVAIFSGGGALRYDAETKRESGLP